MAGGSLRDRLRGRGEHGPDRDDEERPDGRRRALVLAIIALPVLVAFYLTLLYWSTPRTPGDELRLDQFGTMLDQERIRDATILQADSRVAGTYDRGRYWVAYAGGQETQFAMISNHLAQSGIPYSVDQQSIKQLITPLLLLLPALILVDGLVIVFLLFFGRGNGMFGFGRSGARRFGGESRITFADVAGLEEAIEELDEIREYLANPDRFTVMGATVPKGILLTGPPGCGKTLLARAVAGESQVPFYSISGSDFVEMFVGVGAARIRDLFEKVAEAAPAIVFIDELDAVGRGRSSTAIGGQDEREATLNQLLVELDGFDPGSGVVVLAATNRADILDHALLRPGRFDRRIQIDRPDVRGREAILAVHARGKPLATDVDLGRLARRTAGFSGADLANVVNEAALLAARRDHEEIGTALLLEAVERVVAGPERRTRIISAEDRWRLAVHEAGHAVVSAALPSAMVVDKVSVISRAHAGGFTWYVPEATDQVLVTRQQVTDRICALLAGRGAERLLLDQESSTATEDLDRAGRAARSMVCQLGMSAELGPLTISRDLGADGASGLSPYSQQLMAEVDAAVRRVLGEAEAVVDQLLASNRDVLERLAAQLSEEESLEGDALREHLNHVVGDPGARAGGGADSRADGGVGGGELGEVAGEGLALEREGS